VEHVREYKQQRHLKTANRYDLSQAGYLQSITGLVKRPDLNLTFSQIFHL